MSLSSSACPNSPPFVSHLERYTPEGKKAMEQVARNPDSPINLEDVMLTGVEVKKPGTGENGWVKQAAPAAAKIMELKCPDGKTVGIEPVVP